MRFQETMITFFIRLQVLVLSFQETWAGTITKELTKVADYANHERYVASKKALDGFQQAACKSLQIERAFGNCAIRNTRAHIQSANGLLRQYSASGDIGKEQMKVIQRAKDVVEFIESLRTMHTGVIFTAQGNIDSPVTIVNNALEVFLKEHNRRWSDDALALIAREHDPVTSFLSPRHVGEFFECDLSGNEGDCLAPEPANKPIAISIESDLDTYTKDHLHAALEDASYSDAILYLTNFRASLKKLSDELGAFDEKIKQKIFDLGLHEQSAEENDFQKVFNHLWDEIQSESVGEAPVKQTLRALSTALLALDTTGSCIQDNPTATSEAIFQCLTKSN